MKDTRDTIFSPTYFLGWLSLSSLLNLYLNKLIVCCLHLCIYENRATITWERKKPNMDFCNYQEYKDWNTWGQFYISNSKHIYCNLRYTNGVCNCTKVSSGRMIAALVRKHCLFRLLIIIKIIHWNKISLWDVGGGNVMEIKNKNALNREVGKGLNLNTVGKIGN